MYSIVIPAYNEESIIEKTLNDYYNYFKGKHEFEIIVVCDGCTDTTPEIVRKFKKDKPEVKLLVFEKRLGKGGGVIEGFKLARGDIIGFTDADDSTPAEEFEKLINFINGYDCTIGSRAMKESRLVKKQPLKRRVLGFFFRKYVNFLFGLKIRDTQCGAKVFKKNAVKPVIKEMKIRGFSFDVELLYRIKKKGFSIIEVPIKWENYEESKVKFKHVFDMFWSLLKLRFKY